MFQNHRIQSFFFEHIDVLALLYFICHIKQCGLRCIFFLIQIFFKFCIVLLVCSLRVFCGIFFLILCNKIIQSQILAFDILNQNVVHHTVTELTVLDTTIFDERTDIIPIFFIIFTVCLAHTAQLVSYLLADIIRDLLYKSVILQCASGYIQWQIRAIDHTFQQHQEFRNYFFNIIGNKYLIVI